MIPTRGTGQRIDPTTPDGTQPVGSAGAWKLIMSEEFNGAKELIDGPRGYVRFRPDGPKWTDRYSDGWYSVESVNGRESVGPRLHIPLERQYYTHEALTLDGASSLKINATRDFRFGEEYTSGMITSAEFHVQQFGFVEARIKLPIATQAIWPAFWMQPDFKRPDPMHPALWEQSTHYLREVDILETFMDNIAKAALLYPTNGTQVVLGDTGDAWHTYGFEWSKDRSRVYYDGEVKVDSTAFIFEYPMYLLLNFSLRDTGNPTPLDMYCDWIRCYQPA